MVEFGAVGAVNLGYILSLLEKDRWEWSCQLSPRGSRCCSHTFAESDSVPFNALTISLLNTHCFLKNIILTASFQIRSQKLLEEEAIFLAPCYLFVSDKEREIICGTWITREVAFIATVTMQNSYLFTVHEDFYYWFRSHSYSGWSSKRLLVSLFFLFFRI